MIHGAYNVELISELKNSCLPVTVLLTALLCSGMIPDSNHLTDRLSSLRFSMIFLNKSSAVPHIRPTIDSFYILSDSLSLNLLKPSGLFTYHKV